MVVVSLTGVIRGSRSHWSRVLPAFSASRQWLLRVTWAGPATGQRRRLQTGAAGSTAHQLPRRVGLQVTTTLTETRRTLWTLRGSRWKYQQGLCVCTGICLIIRSFQEAQLQRFSIHKYILYVALHSNNSIHSRVTKKVSPIFHLSHIVVRRAPVLLRPVVWWTFIVSGPWRSRTSPEMYGARKYAKWSTYWLVHALFLIYLCIHKPGLVRLVLQLCLFVALIERLSFR